MHGFDCSIYGELFCGLMYASSWSTFCAHSRNVYPPLGLDGVLRGHLLRAVSVSFKGPRSLVACLHCLSSIAFYCVTVSLPLLSRLALCILDLCWVHILINNVFISFNNFKIYLKQFLTWKHFYFFNFSSSSNLFTQHRA